MTMRAPTVFVVHDEAETCDRVHALLNTTGLQTRAYRDIPSFLADVEAEQPGCLVIGTGAAAQEGAGVGTALGRGGALLPVIVVSKGGDAPSGTAALEAGALDVIDESQLRHCLVPAVLRALAADLHSRTLQLQRDDIQLRYAQLTPRECEVLKLVIEGKTSSAIGEELGLCAKTVEVYRSHINKKMRVRNAVQLARIMQGVW